MQKPVWHFVVTSHMLTWEIYNTRAGQGCECEESSPQSNATFLFQIRMTGTFFTTFFVGLQSTLIVKRWHSLFFSHGVYHFRRALQNSTGGHDLRPVGNFDCRMCVVCVCVCACFLFFICVHACERMCVDMYWCIEHFCDCMTSGMWS